MLAVTPSALDHLADLQPPEDGGRVLRLTGSEDGLALVPDEPSDEDVVHECRGRPVLILDETIGTILGGRTLDVSTEGDETTLTLR